jgi:hypothetical protein
MNTIETKHTPGPWIYSGPASSEVYGYRGHYQDTPQTVAKVSGYWDGEAEANARLIAAAPELLEALRGLLKCCEAQPEWSDLTNRVDDAGQPFPSATWIAARRAIAKATLA